MTNQAQAAAQTATTTGTGIRFKRAQLAGFKLIGAGDIGRKLELEVLHNVTEKNLVTSEKSGRESYIVSLKAITPDKVAGLQEVFAETEEVDIEQTNGLFLTANIWKNEGSTPRLPMKGEKVEVIIAEVPNREGEAVLRVGNLQVRAAEEAKSIDLTAMFGASASHEVE